MTNHGSARISSSKLERTRSSSPTLQEKQSAPAESNSRFSMGARISGVSKSQVLPRELGSGNNRTFFTPARDWLLCYDVSTLNAFGSVVRPLCSAVLEITRLRFLRSSSAQIN